MRALQTGAAAVALLTALSLAPASALAAEDLSFVRVTSLTVRQGDTTHDVFVTVSGGKTCGSGGNANGPDGLLRWREVNDPSGTKINFEEGVKLLQAALMSRALMAFRLVDTGTQCRIEKMLMVAP